jgi:hypothetical protein
MKFDPVKPEDVPNMRESHRGRVSYPILKSFMEENLPMARLDRTGMQQSLMALNSSLGAYIRSHGLPVKLFQRKGELYLMRLDIMYDHEDNVVPNPDYIPNQPAGDGPSSTPGAAVTDDEIKRRFDAEKGQVTK